MRRPKPPTSSAETPSRSISIARRATALTIAGSDPSGGAGLQADLKAFQQNGVYGMSVVTLLTVQNTVGVERIEVMPLDLVVQQLDCVIRDIPPLAIKTGALGNPSVLQGVAMHLKGYDGDLIVDPVLISKHGDPLADDSMIGAYRKYLFPIATLITPNRYEAETIVGRELSDIDSFCEAAWELQQMGPKHVLIKAGLIDGLRQHVYADAENMVSIGVDDCPGNRGHGAGCSLSATIAARMSLSDRKVSHAKRMRAAVDFAITAVHASVKLAPQLGKGCSPVEHRALHLG